ncbi:hypothetical protein [Micromonospora sagamiensis]|nr:hypothetical protein [Micromonospora sagamiensis]
MADLPLPQVVPPPGRQVEDATPVADEVHEVLGAARPTRHRLGIRGFVAA